MVLSFVCTSLLPTFQEVPQQTSGIIIAMSTHIEEVARREAERIAIEQKCNKTYQRREVGRMTIEQKSSNKRRLIKHIGLKSKTNHRT